VVQRTDASVSFWQRVNMLLQQTSGNHR